MSSSPHDRLARWLDEASAAEHPSAPEGLEPDVVEAVYALRPDLAPPPRVDIDDILDSLTEGPLAPSPGERAAAADEAEALAAFLDGEGAADLISETLAEGLFALRPALAPAPRVSMDDILGAVTEGPFAPPDNVIPLTTTTTAAATDVPAEVVPLSPRRRGSWWALPGLGALAAAAAALLVVQPLSLNEPAPDLLLDRAEHAPAAAATPSPSPPPQARPTSAAAEQRAEDPKPADRMSRDGNAALDSIDELKQDYRNAPTGGVVGGAAGPTVPEIVEEPEEPEEPEVLEVLEVQENDTRATATPTATTTATLQSELEPDPEPEPEFELAPAAAPEPVLELAPRRAEALSRGDRELTADLDDEVVSESLGALGYLAGEDAAGAEDLAEGEVSSRSYRDQTVLSAGASVEESRKDEAEGRERSSVRENRWQLGSGRSASAPAADVYADAPAMAPMEEAELEEAESGAEDMSTLRLAASRSLSSVPAVASGRPELAAAYAESDALAAQGQLDAARAALEPFRRAAEPDVVLDVAWRRCALYLQRGLVVPGISALDEGLQVIGGDPRLRARLLYQKGQLLERRGDVTGATAAYAEAARLR